VEPGAPNAKGYIYDFVDRSGGILDLNQKYGKGGWTFMQDDASSQTVESSIAYSNVVVDILVGRPSGSPDCNSIANRFTVLKY
jgi:hypothetical protein